MTQDEVAAALAAEGKPLTKAGLSKYERGGSVPKQTMLRAIARVVGVSPEFFIQDPVVKIQWLAFRKRSALGRGEANQIEAIASSRVEAFMTLRRAFEPHREPAVPTPAVVCLPEEAERAAEELRAKWRLGDRPVESVTSVIEDNGGIVIELGSEDDAFDGLCGWADDTIPIIVVSRGDSADRRRFSLAHELGHLFVDARKCDRRTQERIAHRFAAAFLVPAATARRELGDRRRRIDLQELALLKRKHGLSMQGWIARARDLGIIDQGHGVTLFRTFSAKGWRKAEPVSFAGREEPLRLRQLTVRALSEGVLTHAQAARVCPEALLDVGAEGPPVPGSMDARTILNLPKDERERFLAQAAGLVEREYQHGGSLTGFDALSEEDHRDRPVHG